MRHYNGSGRGVRASVPLLFTHRHLPGRHYEHAAALCNSQPVLDVAGSDGTDLRSVGNRIQVQKRSFLRTATHSLSCSNMRTILICSRVYKKGFYKKRQKGEEGSACGYPSQWLSPLRPTLFPHGKIRSVATTSRSLRTRSVVRVKWDFLLYVFRHFSLKDLQTTNALYVQVKLLCSQPEPSWSLLLQVYVLSSYFVSGKSISGCFHQTISFVEPSVPSTICSPQTIVPTCWLCCRRFWWRNTHCLWCCWLKLPSARLPLRRDQRACASPWRRRVTSCTSLSQTSSSSAARCSPELWRTFSWPSWKGFLLFVLVSTVLSGLSKIFLSTIAIFFFLQIRHVGVVRWQKHSWQDSPRECWGGFDSTTIVTECASRKFCNLLLVVQVPPWIKAIVVSLQPFVSRWENYVFYFTVFKHSVAAVFMIILWSQSDRTGRQVVDGQTHSRAWPWVLDPQHGAVALWVQSSCKAGSPRRR